jgi:hypothetical protein
MYQQAVVRLCQGAADKEAGRYASNSRPKNKDPICPVLQEFIRRLAGIIELHLGRFWEFSKTKPFF